MSFWGGGAEAFGTYILQIKRGGRPNSTLALTLTPNSTLTQPKAYALSATSPRVQDFLKRNVRTV